MYFPPFKGEHKVKYEANESTIFVLDCDALQTTRAPLLQKIITEGIRVFDQIAHSIDLLQLIINPTLRQKLSTTLYFYRYIFLHHFSYTS